jgi:hypothetical protein
MIALLDLLRASDGIITTCAANAVPHISGGAENLDLLLRGQTSPDVSKHAGGREGGCSLTTKLFVFME